MRESHNIALRQIKLYRVAVNQLDFKNQMLQRSNIYPIKKTCIYGYRACF